jgi:hypothetical protein
MRSKQRPRRYLAGHWIAILRPLLRYSTTRDAFVLRLVGGSRGPVLRRNRRARHQAPFAGPERRGARSASSAA